MNKQGTKTIRVSKEDVEFLQEKMVPLSGTSVSDVLERALGIPREGEDPPRMFWLVKSQEHTQVIAMHTAETRVR